MIFARGSVTAFLAFVLQGGLSAAPAVGPMATPAALPLTESRAEAVVVNSSEPRVFPNPWRADRNQGAQITFDRLPPESTVRIFTLSGQEIKTLDSNAGVATWDRTTDGGDPAASGIYLYLVSDILGQEFRGKLALIR